MKFFKKSIALLMSGIMTLLAAFSVPGLSLTAFAEADDDMEKIVFYNQGVYSNGATATEGWQEATYTSEKQPGFSIIGLKSSYSPNKNQRINLTNGVYTNWSDYAEDGFINFDVVNVTQCQVACARLFKAYDNYKEVQGNLKEWGTEMIQQVSYPLSAFAEAGYDLNYVGSIGLDRSEDIENSNFYVTRIYLTYPKRVPAEISISKNLEDKEATVGDPEQILYVTASTTGKKFLQYKWYECDDAEGTNSVEIEGETGSSLKVSTTEAGTFYRYVIISAEDAATPIRSAIAKVTIKKPERSIQYFNNGEFGEGVENAGFEDVFTWNEVECLRSRFGQNEYQRVKFHEWKNLSGYKDGVIKVTFYNDTPSSSGDIRIFSDDETYVGVGVNYSSWQSNTPQTVSIPLATAEKIGANLKGISGIGFYPTNADNYRIYVSDISLVYVEDPLPTKFVVIKDEPDNVSVFEGDEEPTLKVNATVSGIGTDPVVLQYAWYSCDADGKNPTLVEGATGDTLAISTAVPGEFYYYAVVSADGFEPATTRVAKATVKATKKAVAFFNDGKFDEYAANAGFEEVAPYIDDEAGEHEVCLKSRYNQYEYQRVKFTPYQNLSNYTDGFFEFTLYNPSPATEAEIRVYSDNENYKAFPVELMAWQKKTPQSVSVSLEDVKNAGFNLTSVAGVGIYATNAGESRIYVSNASLAYYTEPQPIMHKVTFDKNGGTGTMKDFDVQDGRFAKLPKNTFTRKGYTFDGWKDQFGKSYANEEVINTKVDLTLTAQWKTVTYKITYKLNGGKNSSKNPTKYNVKSKEAKLVAATKTGYTFAGWYTSSSYKTKITSIKGSACKNYTLYAKWTANKYSIKFYANGGKGTMKTLSATYGKTVTLTKNKFTKKGYKFKGWATSSTNAKKGKVAHKNAAKVKSLTSKAKGVVKLYAVWKK